MTTPIANASSAFRRRFSTRGRNARRDALTVAGAPAFGDVGSPVRGERPTAYDCVLNTGRSAASAHPTEKTPADAISPGTSFAAEQAVGSRVLAVRHLALELQKIVPHFDGPPFQIVREGRVHLDAQRRRRPIIRLHVRAVVIAGTGWAGGAARCKFRSRRRRGRPIVVLEQSTGKFAADRFLQYDMDRTSAGVVVRVLSVMISSRSKTATRRTVRLVASVRRAVRNRGRRIRGRMSVRSRSVTAFPSRT